MCWTVAGGGNGTERAMNECGPEEKKMLEEEGDPWYQSQSHELRTGSGYEKS